MRVIWAPRAIARAADIAQYIAADRPGAAAAWVEQLFAKAATLRRHARRGKKVPEVHRDQIRQILPGKHRIIYRVDPKRMVVLTVRIPRSATISTSLASRLSEVQIRGAAIEVWVRRELSCVHPACVLLPS
jgi:plasmid stabilization system protein ParE